MSFVLRLQTDIMLICAQIIVSVRHSEPALQEVWHVFPGVIEVRRNENTKEPVGVKIRRVQWVHISSKLRAELPRERCLVVDRVDLGKLVLDRAESAFFDGRLVQIGLVIVTDLSYLWVFRARCRRYQIGLFAC